MEEVNSLSLSLSVLSGAAAENMLGSLLCLPGSGSVLLDPYGSTISETTSEAWSVEVLPSDSGRDPGSFFSFLLFALVIVLIRPLPLLDACIFMFVGYSGGWDTRCGFTAIHTKNVCASVIIFVCTSLSFMADLRVPVKGRTGFP